MEALCVPFARPTTNSTQPGLRPMGGEQGYFSAVLSIRHLSQQGRAADAKGIYRQAGDDVSKLRPCFV